MPELKSSYDPACQDLAEHFLRDEPYTHLTAAKYEARVRSLSKRIQEAVEAWFEGPPAPSGSTPQEEP